MYQLMIAVGFLKGEHPKYRWGSAAACDLGYAVITQFEEVVGSDDEVPNPEAKREEVFTEDELEAGEMPVAHTERRRLQRNKICAERRRMERPILEARLRAEEEEAELEDKEVEEVEEEVPALC